MCLACYIASWLAALGCFKAKRWRWLAFWLALFLAATIAVLLHSQGDPALCRLLP